MGYFVGRRQRYAAIGRIRYNAPAALIGFFNRLSSLAALHEFYYRRTIRLDLSS